jgi:hypothetical protein
MNTLTTPTLDDAIRLLGLCHSSKGHAWTVWNKYVNGEEADTLISEAEAYWLDWACSAYDELVLDAGHDLLAGPVDSKSITGNHRVVVNCDDKRVGAVVARAPRFGWDDYLSGQGHKVDEWATLPGEVQLSFAQGWMRRERMDYPAPLVDVARVYLTMAALLPEYPTLEWVDLIVLFGPHDLRRIRFRVDHLMVRQLRSELQRLWGEVVVDRQEPEPDGSHAAWDKLLTRPRSTKEMVEVDLDDEQLQSDVVAYVCAELRRKDWEHERKVVARPALLEALADNHAKGFTVEACAEGIPGVPDGTPGTYSLSITTTGRVYARFIPSKQES